MWGGYWQITEDTAHWWMSLIIRIAMKRYQAIKTTDMNLRSQVKQIFAIICVKSWFSHSKASCHIPRKSYSKVLYAKSSQKL